MPSGTRPGREVDAARAGGGFSGRGAAFGGNDRPGQVGRGGSAFASRAMQNPMQDAAFGTGIRGAPFAGMGGLNARRTPNVSPSYQGTLGNFAKAISRGIPGPGMIGGAIADIAGLRSGFTGYTGQRFGPGDYDAQNRGPADRMMELGTRQRPMPRVAPIAPPPAIPPLGTGFVPAASLSVPGMGSYGVNLPSYGYFGQPGQVRPSAILGPERFMGGRRSAILGGL